jgi:hypothetical protein
LMPTGRHSLSPASLIASSTSPKPEADHRLLVTCGSAPVTASTTPPSTAKAAIPWSAKSMTPYHGFSASRIVGPLDDLGRAEHPDQSKPAEHDRPEHAADPPRTIPLAGEQDEEDQQRERQHVVPERGAVPNNPSRISAPWRRFCRRAGSCRCRRRRHRARSPGGPPSGPRSGSRPPPTGVGTSSPRPGAADHCRRSGAPLAKQREEQADAGRGSRDIDNRRRRIDRSIVTSVAVVMPITPAPAVVVSLLAERRPHG